MFQKYETAAGFLAVLVSRLQIRKKTYICRAMNRLVVIIIASACLLLHSCGSKRSTQRQPGYPAEQSSAQSENAQTSGGTARAVISEAEQWLGTPYKYGGQQCGIGTDCSGMVMAVYEAAAGIQLPRNAAKQQLYCQAVNKEELQPGDLVFFSSSSRGGRVSHVGIYRGNGEFIHASSSKGVIVSNLDQQYYRKHYHSAGRILPAADTPATLTPSAISQADNTPPAQAVCDLVPQTVDTTLTADANPDRQQYEISMQRAQLDLDSIIVSLVDSINAPEDAPENAEATP